jgi:predicted permease
VIGQIGLSVVVIICASLLGRSLFNLRTISGRFDPERVLLFSLDGGTALDQAHVAAYYHDLLERLRALPGVMTASASTSSPIHTSGSTRGLDMPGLPVTPEAHGVWANVITPDYFETFRIHLIRGRMFTSQDVREARRVAIVNEAMSRFYFGELDPAGRAISFMSAPKDMITIVGLVQDVHQDSLWKVPPRMVYTPLAQADAIPRQLTVEVRTAQNPTALAGLARDLVTSLNRDSMITYVRTLEQQVNASLVRERTLAMLSASLGMLALMLACVGLYTLISNDVTRRSREIGIRMALGATRASVVMHVLRETLTVSTVGIALGVLAALAVSGTVSTFLFGLPPRDPVTLASVATIETRS